MNIRMVVKIKVGGILCRKCKETKEYLKDKGYWDLVTEVVEIEEDNPKSKGWELAKKYDIERAPFFIVSEGDEETVYNSVLRLEKDVLKNLN